MRKTTLFLITMALTLLIVIATKKAPHARDLDRIEIEMPASRSGLVIRSSRHLNASVELEIITPVDTRLELGTLLGNVDVRGLNGGVSVGSVLGSVMIVGVGGEISIGSAVGPFVDVHRATGPVQLSAGAGGLYYEGTPVGDCSFTAGGGRIALVLPSFT
jgi:hypothetical protein